MTTDNVLSRAEEFVERSKQILLENLQEAYLFGSAAVSEKFKDIDIMLVVDDLNSVYADPTWRRLGEELGGIKSDTVLVPGYDQVILKGRLLRVKGEEAGPIMAGAVKLTTKGPNMGVEVPIIEGTSRDNPPIHYIILDSNFFKAETYGGKKNPILAMMLEESIQLYKK